MDDVELIHAVADRLHHQQMGSDTVTDRGIEAQGLGTHRLETCAGDRVTAGEQCYVMAHRHQFFRKEGDDTLGAAIEARGNSLIQRRSLGDTHGRDTLLCGPMLSVPANARLSSGIAGSLNGWSQPDNGRYKNLP